MKWLKWTALVLVALVLLLAGVTAWLLGTQSGARRAAAIASNVLAEKLHIGAVEGTLSGPLTLTNLRYRDPEVGVDVRAERILLDLALTDLVRWLLHVEQAQLSGVQVDLSEPTRAAPEPSEGEKPFMLEAPIDVVVDSFTARDIRVRRDETQIFDVTRAVFAGHWRGTDLAVERLDLRSSQGEVQFAGRVSQSNLFAGEGSGRFRWQVGERTFAGGLRTEARDENASLTLSLTSPATARLEVFLNQTGERPWRFALDVPRFDPRERLLPDSSLSSLAAKLEGNGSLERGTVSGDLLVNDEPIRIDHLAFERKEEVVSLDALLRIAKSAGELRARGDVRFESDPWTAQLALDWGDIVIPAVWAGQELHTRGQLSFDGNAERYSTKGTLSIGPPARVANVSLDVDGSSEAVLLNQFDIVQKQGRLAASGRVQLQPALAWDVTATARRFDPGALAAGWRGNLAFDLSSTGRMTEQGPEGRLTLEDLAGDLRGRTVAGRADLSITPARVISGVLDLRSGQSELRFRGEPGEELDATLAVEIASLNDWLPDAGGRLSATSVVRGKWPALSIVADARGNALHAAGVRVDSLALDAKIDDLSDPAGFARIDLERLAAAGFEFEALRARLSGEEEAHRLTLTGTGRPLAFEVGLQGERIEKGWAGVLENLVLDVENAARLALREPARIEWQERAIEVSRACLVDGAIEVCAGGSSQPDGSMEAAYSIANVPLALGNVFAPQDMPIELSGTLQGRGTIRRTPEGELFGEVSLASPEGRIARLATAGAEETQEAEAQAPPETLLSYRALQVNATLAGRDGNGTVSAQLQENGSLSARGTVRGLGELESPLEAELNASFPDLAPFGVFVAQVADFGGALDARVAVTGTLQEPQIGGELNVRELRADLPALGLRLENGRLEARPGEANRIDLSGGVDSGDGHLAFSGQASPEGEVTLQVSGDRFLAADIPGARVIVTPALEFVRAGERMQLSGEVTIPEAAVNLQKLPRDGDRAQQASPDVVIIDEERRQEEVEKAPLYANITVALGEKVELTGFGLQAQVQGRLDVREVPGEPTTGSGEVRVSGTYKAFGQDLTIQRGELSYAASPLDDPGLNIEAIRVVEEVTAGLRVRGTARSPELTVFSDPPMAESEALAYLVTGKPLDQVGSGEGDTMQTAARSLGSAAGGLLARNLGRRLGVDEVAVKEEQMLGGSALTVGEYLSPRLYLSYGVGLFEPGEVVTLRYELSKELAVQTQRGPEATRAGIQYRIEK
ncbi:MAG TPA: translocation/assembly module TamB domain-containing protein [Steroidobacteraceae bacterium]